jgi:GT2 family glycosyltransferase
MLRPRDPTISVVIPVHKGGAEFRQCLAALTQVQPPPHEVIVVADGHADDSAHVAEELGVQVARLPVRQGPSKARNVGARLTHGDIIFFLDADVVVRPDTLQRAAAVLCSEPDVAAVFGSYDDAPTAPNFLSQYKNLLHHFTHQTAREEASTFFSGCGAIWRNVFVAAGGFDEGYTRAAIQDIELGYRLRRQGHRIRLCKALQVTHLKRWGVRSLLVSDFFDRALPWSELIIRREGFVNDLNLRMASRVSVVCAFCALALGMAAWWKLSAVFAVLLVVLNVPLYRFLYDKRGLWFTLRAVPWHCLYFLYSGLAFGITALRYLVNGREAAMTVREAIEDPPQGIG